MKRLKGGAVERIALHSRALPRNLLMQSFKYVELFVRILPKCLHADIIHCHDLDPLLIAVLVKWISGNRIRIIYDAHEFETERGGYSGIQKRFWQWLEKFCLTQIDAFITVSESILREYEKRYGIPKEKQNLVLNCPPHVVLDSSSRRDYFRKRFSIQKDQKIFLYQGNVTRGRGVEELVRYFSTCAPDNAVLVVMGFGSLVREVEEISRVSKKVFLHPPVEPDELHKYTCAADVGIHPMQADCLNKLYCLPNKFFEYAMSGLPVIVTDLPEMAALVRKFQNGFVYDSSDPNGLGKAIEGILANDLSRMASHSLKMMETYNWEEQEKTLLRIYSKLGFEIRSVAGLPLNSFGDFR